MVVAFQSAANRSGETGVGVQRESRRVTRAVTPSTRTPSVAAGRAPSSRWSTGGARTPGAGTHPAGSRRPESTGSSASAIERAAERNVEEARRPWRLIRTSRSSVHLTVESDTTFDELVDTGYARSDENGVKIAYGRSCTLTESLEHTARNRLITAVEGPTRDGDVKAFVDE